jgi:hypothetical protein
VANAWTPEISEDIAERLNSEEAQREEDTGVIHGYTPSNQVSEKRGRKRRQKRSYTVINHAARPIRTATLTAMTIKKILPIKWPWKPMESGQSRPGHYFPLR